MSRTTSTPSISTQQEAEQRKTQLWLIFVVLIGLNLRPFLTASGTLARDISQSLGMPLGQMAWLTFIPMLIMGIGAFCIPSIRNWVDTRRLTLIALVFLFVGSAWRLTITSNIELIMTAVLCGVGVAVLQTLLPGIIKQNFPQHVAPVTGLYSATLMGGGAFGAQFTPLLNNWTDSWRFGLAFWALPVLVAVWIAYRVLPVSKVVKTTTALPLRSYLALPRTWALIASFGLINAGYATLITWLAVYYQGHGWSPTASGSLVAVLSIAQAVSALAIPSLAAKNKDRRLWVWLVLLFQFVGFLAISYIPDAAPYLWAVILGIGLGGCFAMVMVVALDHYPDSQRAGVLSALMQGGGFPIAALAPIIGSVIYDYTGSFHILWLMHLCFIAFIAILTYHFQPQHYARVMKH